MGSFDSVTWQALTLILTVAGLIGTGLVWRARGPIAGLRMLAVALLPAAAYLTGTLRLLWEVGDAVVSWAVRLAFSPSVWLGVSLAGASVLLFVVASFLGRRGIGRSGREKAQLPSGRSRAPARQQPPADEDLDDIEAILKRHGIS